MDKVKKLTAEEITNFLKEKFSDKRADRSTQKLMKYPAKGVFAYVGTTKAKIADKDVEYPCVFITDADGKDLGNISFASIYRYIATGKTMVVSKKDSAYVGKFMNSTTLLHDFCKNRSEAEAIEYVLGKNYTAKDKNVVLSVVDYDEPTKVVKSICSTEAECADYRVAKDVCFIALSGE